VIRLITVVIMLCDDVIETILSEWTHPDDYDTIRQVSKKYKLLIDKRCLTVYYRKIRILGPNLICTYTDDYTGEESNREIINVVTLSSLALRDWWHYEMTPIGIIVIYNNHVIKVYDPVNLNCIMELKCPPHDYSWSHQQNAYCYVSTSHSLVVVDIDNSSYTEYDCLTNEMTVKGCWVDANGRIDYIHIVGDNQVESIYTFDYDTSKMVLVLTMADFNFLRTSIDDVYVDNHEVYVFFMTTKKIHRDFEVNGHQIHFRLAPEKCCSILINETEVNQSATCTGKIIDGIWHCNGECRVMSMNINTPGDLVEKVDPAIHYLQCVYQYPGRHTVDIRSNEETFSIPTNSLSPIFYKATLELPEDTNRWKKTTYDLSIPKRKSMYFEKKTPGEIVDNIMTCFESDPFNTSNIHVNTPNGDYFTIHVDENVRCDAQDNLLVMTKGVKTKVYIFPTQYRPQTIPNLQYHNGKPMFFYE
jgi:hypothetical protein